MNLSFRLNPWEEITLEDERKVILQILNTKFSDSEIIEKIIKPLAESLIKV